MVSDKFRHQLRREVEQWKIEGLIEDNIYQQLAERYQFDDLDTSARNRFVAILFGLGSILLGLGLITLVAANWQIWSRESKMLLLIFIFIGINTTGFYLWNSPNDRGQKRLGQGLLLLGALLLGANMGLMSQMFHQSGAIYELFLIWGLGVLAMAYSLNLESLGIVAVILLGISYQNSMWESWWHGSNFSGSQLAIEYMPLLISFLFIPLAYRCRSNWLFGLSVFLAIYSFILHNNLVFNGISISISYCLPAALLWAYKNSLWTHSSSNQNLFDRIARNLAIFCLSCLFYWFSFHWIWENSWNVTRSEIDDSTSNLINIIIFLAITIYAWWQLGRTNNSRWQIDRTSSFVGMGLIISGSLFWYQTSIGNLNGIATTIFNLMLLFLAIELIRQALATGKRGGFWSGIILLVVQICSRMLEYETELILKAIVLFICGIAIILAGLWFERYLQTLNSNNN